MGVGWERGLYRMKSFENVLLSVKETGTSIINQAARDIIPTCIHTTNIRKCSLGHFVSIFKWWIWRATALAPQWAYVIQMKPTFFPTISLCLLLFSPCQKNLTTQQNQTKPTKILKKWTSWKKTKTTRQLGCSLSRIQVFRDPFWSRDSWAFKSYTKEMIYLKRLGERVDVYFWGNLDFFLFI